MKYMTAELIARFRSEDDAVAEPAVEEWERRGEAYRSRLAEIAPSLPPGVRPLLRYPLHDARVLAIAADDTPSFSFFLELAGPAASRGKYLELRYRLVGRAKDGLALIHHEALAGDGRPLGNVEPIFNDLQAELKGETDRLHTAVTTYLPRFNQLATRLGLQPVTEK